MNGLLGLVESDESGAKVGGLLEQEDLLVGCLLN